MEARQGAPTSDSSAPRRYWGKCRGTVVSTVDPLGPSRLMADVEALPAVTLSWALPCVRYAGPRVGVVGLPPVGVHVWIELRGVRLVDPASVTADQACVKARVADGVIEARSDYMPPLLARDGVVADELPVAVDD
jgi:hypothetical protein